MTDMDAVGYESAPIGYRELRTRAVVVPQVDWTVFSLTGSDATEWLQGQATNDVRSLSKEGLDFCLVRATGQIEAVCRAWRTDGGITVATDAPSRMFERFEKTVVMEEVFLEEIGRAVCIQGPKCVSSALVGDWTGSGGHLAIGGGDQSLPVLSDDAFRLATLEAGIPLRNIDFTEKTLLPELGSAFDARYVSYQKGCYMGQEVLMRIRSRGHTNKTWVGLASEHELKVGSEVTQGGSVVGVVHRTAVSPTLGFVAGATLRNSACAPGTVVVVQGQTVAVRHFPLIERTYSSQP